MRFKIFAGAAALTLAAGFAFATDSTPGARAHFINLTNGQHVKSPVLIQFGLSGIGIAPAGSNNRGTGHHHLIIDADTPGAGAPISMDDKHMHFGRGQTEVSLPLAPGRRALQLVLADGGHIPFTPPVVPGKVTVTVDP
jgi:hypothetical protein